MPKENTHLFFARELTNTVLDVEIVAMISRHISHFYLGSVIPDTFYYGNTAKIITVSDSLHGKDGNPTGSIVIEMLDQAKNPADIVFAMGSPFGFSKTVTMGIVSTNRRQLSINGVRYPDLIQTDAVINDGDDGGALINIKGEVIGINMAYFVPSNHFTGIGFALPINDAKPLLNAVK